MSNSIPQRTTISKAGRKKSAEPPKTNGKGKMLAAALGYAARGWPVFPLATHRKEPLKSSKGFHEATTDIDTITLWWTKIPDANIGIATGRVSGIFVMDVDVHHDGEQSLHHFEEQGLTMEGETLVVGTPRGGWHYYFQYPEGVDLRGSHDRLARGIDIRANGGYIVAPPSYVIDPKKDIDGGYTTEYDTSIAPAPQWMIDALVKESGDKLYQNKGPIPEGKRDATLTSIGGKLRSQGKEYEQILAALHQENQRCETPLEDPDLERIAKSVCNYPRGNVHQNIIDELALLSPGEYEVQRKAIAKQLGYRTSVLDHLVAEARKTHETTEIGGTDILFKGVEPWTEPVEAQELLDEITDALKDYVILSDHQSYIAALWILSTYVHDAFDIHPILAVTSPEKRCGKTTLLKVLNRLCHRALPASNVTPSALFRTTEKYCPTLLVDEGDTFLKTSDELRGILNSGHDREHAFVIRTVGDDHEPKRFSTWAAKVIAMIGELPDTLHDRSVVIQLRRKMPGEDTIQLTRDSSCMRSFHLLCRKLLRWGQDTMELFRTRQPEIPEELFNRSADNFRPLLAIADLAGGEWPELARESALKITETTSDEKSIKAQLLEDIKEIFEQNSFKFCPSQELVDKLNSMEERPWGDWYGKAFTTNKLARMLKPFDIKPTLIRSGRNPVRGYELKSFMDAFNRYLK